MTNSSNANTTAYFKIEYSVNNGSSFSTATGGSNVSVAENGSATVTQSVSDGQTIIWRYEASTTSNTLSLIHI